jgi:light-regulated signal transduction histidine kinase (bacteriophytochrome)
MQTTIEDLLAFSRISREERPLAAVDCEWVFERAMGNLAAAIEAAGATVTSDMLPAVWGDEAQLVQLFQNLLANGIKFRGDAPPQVHVSARLENGEWAFSVRDNGIGIAPEDVPRLFTIFERLHSQEEYPGTGIGLALCKRIVERHGGRIGVESTPGKGSVFSFTLYPAPERG